jgi:hypothetical protein
MAVKDSGVVLTPLQRLADALLDRIDVIVEHSVERIQEQLPSYARLPRADLLPVLRQNTRNILTAVRDPDAAPSAESEDYRQSGEVRAAQGITSDEMLHAWRIALEVTREEARAVAGSLDIGDGVLLEFVETTLRLADIGMLSTAAAHREAELEISRHEQDHRANLVRGVLFGTLSTAAVRVETAAYGLDPAASYCAVRARPGSEVTVRSLEAQLGIADGTGSRRGLGALLDGDLAGFLLVPVRHTVKAPVGIGPEAPLHALENSYRVATRALETAIASNRSGLVGIDDLGLAPAVLADGDIGDSVTARIIEPVLAHGRAGAALLETVTRYLENDQRLEVTAEELYLHVNTVRYRLRRFEELTDTSLRHVDDLVEVWWAIQHNRMTAKPDPNL